MNVQAKCNVNYNGIMHRAGETFEMNDADALNAQDAVTVLEPAGKTEGKQADAPKSESKPRRKTK